jgi:hypothetical protein
MSQELSMTFFRHRRPSLKNLFGIVGGCLIATIGCCVLLYIYAFAAMISPRITGWDRWMLILHKMLWTPAAVPVFFGVFALGVGVAIVTVSLRSAFGLDANNMGHIRLLTILAAVVLFLAVLLVILL